MLNFRNIDKTFSLSGGWENINLDADGLNARGIDCVLDLQMTPDDTAFNDAAIIQIEGLLNTVGIKYLAIPMFDGPNRNLAAIYSKGAAQITEWLQENPRAQILVKCGAGVSRSVGMLIYYMCAIQGMVVEEAYNKITNKSNGIYLASEFRDFLGQYSMYAK